MNKQEKPLLSEERKNEVCICDCGYYPLKHFERCPKCNCMSFHLVMTKFTPKKVENENDSRSN